MIIFTQIDLKLLHQLGKEFI